MILTEYLINRAKKTPYSHLDGYMNRWWLVPYAYEGSRSDEGCGTVCWYKRPFSWLIQKLGVAVRIHEILRSDDTRDLHDHPWPFITVLLKGSYVEHMPGQIRLRKQGSILFRSIKDRHALELICRQPATTLFITFKYKQKWGFWVTPTEKIPYDKYLDSNVN